MKLLSAPSNWLHPRWAALAACLLLGPVAWAADPGAPTGVTVADDEEDDVGTSVVVTWIAPVEATWPAGMVLAGYQVYVAKGQAPLKPVQVVGVHAPPPDPEEPGAEEAEAEQVGAEELAPLAWPNAIVGDLKFWPRQPHTIQVAAIYLPEGLDLAAPLDVLWMIAREGWRAARSDAVGQVRPVGKWYEPKHTNVLVLMLLYGIIVIATIAWVGKRAEDVYIRPIAGLEAVNDAIGRATEMGKPIIYVSGLDSISSISTIASVLILGHLSKRTAYYETDVIVPCTDSLVMTAEREVVRQSYLEAGKPDAYKPENIFFVTDSQFGYAAAVDGIMMREKPAAVFYMGYFYAEALILAETGNETGAIQIAGTDADTQLPFFITACDYTLMGEELYAASAYLSKQPLLVAQLRGQDIGKFLVAATLLLGAAAATWALWGATIADKFLAWFAG